MESPAYTTVAISGDTHGQHEKRADDTSDISLDQTSTDSSAAFEPVVTPASTLSDPANTSQNVHIDHPIRLVG